MRNLLIKPLNITYHYASNAHVQNLFSVLGTMLGYVLEHKKKRWTNFLPFRGFWITKQEKVLRWTGEGRTFQVD